jgi:hypothetical protein
MVSGWLGSAKSTVRGAPAVLAKGVNAGAGYLLTSLLAGGIEGVAGGRLGRFNGVASALVGMLIARLLPDKYVSKIPYASKSDMMIGVGLYGVVQLAGLLLPESWRARLGLSGCGYGYGGMGEYMTGAMGGFGDYVGLPGNGMRQTVGGLGHLSEYVAMGNPNAAAQARSDVAAAQSMAASNPISVADAMLDQSEFQEATFWHGEYVDVSHAGWVQASRWRLQRGYWLTRPVRDVRQSRASREPLPELRQHVLRARSRPERSGRLLRADASDGPARFAGSGTSAGGEHPVCQSSGRGRLRSVVAWSGL